MYGDTAPSLALWRTELAVQQSGWAAKDEDMEAALKVLDKRFARLSALAIRLPVWSMTWCAMRANVSMSPGPR